MPSASYNAGTCNPDSACQSGQAILIFFSAREAFFYLTKPHGMDHISSASPKMAKNHFANALEITVFDDFKGVFGVELSGVEPLTS